MRGVTALYASVERFADWLARIPTTQSGQVKLVWRVLCTEEALRMVTDRNDE